MRTSIRLARVPPSPIRELAPLAIAAKKNGTRVYHLNIGDPDIKTPEVMIQALKAWNMNPIRYSQSQGEEILLQALGTYYHGLGFDFVETSDMQVTSGGSEAISMAMFAVTAPGEEILTFEPLYTNYNSYAAMNGVRLQAVPTRIEDGFHLPSQKAVEQRITKKTRAILYCNPNNPTGTVYTQKEIEMLVAIAKKYRLFLLSDEVYREYVYDRRKHVSLFSYMQDIPKQAIVLDSMSKRYSLCGARIGAMVSLNTEIMDGVLHIAQGRLSAGLIDQHVAAKLTEVPKKYLADVREEYKKRRDVLYKGLADIPGVIIGKPEGAFYAIVGLPVDDAGRFCRWLLTDFRDKGETVMVAPAAGFYATAGRGKNEVRIAYVLNTRDLGRCVQLLALAIRRYQQKIK